MATLRTVFRTTLENDAALMALLTGGVKDPDVLPIDGGGSGSVPREADNVTLRPFAIVRFGASSVSDPWRLAPQVQSVETYVYANRGYATIDAALSRIDVLMHDKYLTADDVTFAHVLVTFQSADLDAQEIGGAPMRFIRLAITLTRR